MEGQEDGSSPSHDVWDQAGPGQAPWGWMLKRWPVAHPQCSLWFMPVPIASARQVIEAGRLLFLKSTMVPHLVKVIFCPNIWESKQKTTSLLLTTVLLLFQSILGFMETEHSPRSLNKLLPAELK